MKYLICGILGIAIGFFVFYLLFRIANKDKLCKKLQDGSKKKLPKPNFTKLVLVAVLFTYFVGLYIGIKVTLIDISLGYTERIAGMTANTPQDTSYRVKINTAVLNVRKGPGTNYPVTTQVKQGEVYTIVGEEKNGNTTWGKLKSGAGYISLGYTQRA